MANDAIVISGAMNVWIDHCELYSDLTHDKDYYDGLLEIKNGAVVHHRVVVPRSTTTTRPA